MYYIAGLTADQQPCSTAAALRICEPLAQSGTHAPLNKTIIIIKHIIILIISARIGRILRGIGRYEKVRTSDTIYSSADIT